MIRNGACTASLSLADARRHEPSEPPSADAKGTRPQAVGEKRVDIALGVEGELNLEAGEFLK